MSTTILTASNIITMDPTKPRATALAIDDDSGRIVAVGSLDECREQNPSAEVRDLGSTVVMPGFIDPHSHPFISGTVTQPPAVWIAPYVGCPTWDDVVAKIKELNGSTAAGKPLFLTGLDRMLHRAPSVDRALLDEIVADRPITILDNSGHEMYFNSGMVDFLGWQAGPPADPVGGSYGRNDDGSSNGTAHELSAVLSIAQPVLAAITEHPLLPGAHFFKLMAQHGITATADLTYSTEYLPAYRALASVPDIPVRMSLYHVSYADDAHEHLPAEIDSNLVRKEGVKLWGDGSPWIGNIASSFAYCDNETVRNAGIPLGPGGEANMNYSRVELDAILDKFAPQGWQMAFHVNGDVAIDIVLDAYERALHKHGLIGTDHRWRLEHCGAGRPDQYARAASLGVTASLGPFQFIYWGDLLDGTLFDSEVGSQWQAFHGAEVAGIEPSYHNDGSVSPPNPLLNVQAAITRATPSGQVHGANQRVSIEAALRAITINAARHINRDNDAGSITVGKFADLVELSLDPYLADPMRLADQVKVLGTWLGGHRVDIDGFMEQVASIPLPKDSA